MSIITSYIVAGKGFATQKNREAGCDKLKTKSRLKGQDDDMKSMPHNVRPPISVAMPADRRRDQKRSRNQMCKTTHGRRAVRALSSYAIEPTRAPCRNALIGVPIRQRSRAGWVTNR